MRGLGRAGQASCCDVGFPRKDLRVAAGIPATLTLTLWGEQRG